MDAGLEKFGARAAMVRRRASTCFAFMLPENKVRAVDLFAQTEGVWRGVSPPTRESRLGRMVWAPACNPNPMYIRACRRACFANGSPFRRRSPASEGGPATLPAWKLPSPSPVMFHASILLVFVLYVFFFPAVEEKIPRHPFADSLCRATGIACIL